MEAESHKAPTFRFHTPGIEKADLLPAHRLGNASGAWARKGAPSGIGCGDGVP